MWQKIREEKGLTQEELGKMFGYSRIRISQYERGYRKMPEELQIKYLELRGNKEDLEIIKCLKKVNEYLGD